MLHKLYVNKTTGRVTKNPARNSEPVWFACKSLTTVEWYTGLILNIEEWRDASRPRHQPTTYEPCDDAFIDYLNSFDD